MEQVDYLIKKHRELDRQIADLEQIRPDARTGEQSALISALKKRKLRIRDQIALRGSAI